MDTKDIIETAKKRFQWAVENEAEDREQRLDDVKFVRLGEQWPENVRRDREMPGRERPMLTINRIFQFRNQIINEIRQNQPGIKVRPVDDKADVKTADVIQGIIRHIQDISHADVAYDTAAEWQVDTGLGYFRIITEYMDEDSFDQEIKIQRIADPFRVYFGPYTEVDGSDAAWAFIAEEIPREDFEKQYPDVDFEQWGAGGRGDQSGWISDKSVRVVEYFEIETRKQTLSLLSDGAVTREDVPKEYQPLVKRSRQVEVKICKWRKIGGDSILEESEIPCSYIPIIPVLGNEVWVEGKRHLHGLTRFGKDPQRQYNYLQSANTETLALAPRAPYIGVEGQFEGHEQEWSLANRVNLTYLEYKPVSIMGTPAPPPQRTPLITTNPGFEAGMMRAVDDLKASMGIYDASLGNRESAQSGRAILSQQQQANTGNFHYADNVARSIKHAGRIILELIPKIYDAPRIARILGEDGTPGTAQIDPRLPQAIDQRQRPDGGIQTLFNPGIGKYDIVVDVGPSYLTRRQEAANAMTQLGQAFPQLWNFAGDLVVRTMDWPDADKIADRLKKALPPNLQDAPGDQGDAKPDMAQITAQMQQMASMVEHLSQELQAAMDERSLKERELEIKEFDAVTKRLQVESSIATRPGEVHAQAIANMREHMQMLEPSGEEIGEDAGLDAKESDSAQPPKQPTTVETTP